MSKTSKQMGKLLMKGDSGEPCGVAWDLAKSVHKLKNKDKATLYSPIQAKETKEMIAAPAPTSNPPMRKIICGGLRSINAPAGQKGLDLRCPTTVVTASRKVQTNDEAQVFTILISS